MALQEISWSEAQEFKDYVIKTIQENILRKEQGLLPTIEYKILIEVYPGKEKVNQLWKIYLKEQQHSPLNPKS